MTRVTSFGLVLLLCVACGDSSGTGGSGGASPDCIEDPFSCPQGQTCWLDTDQTSFRCLNSGAGQVGDTCRNFVGEPTCTDGLTCLQLEGASQGVCTPFCNPNDPEHDCPNDARCLTVTLEDSQFHACEPEGGVGGSGGSGEGGAGGAGGG